MFELYAQKTHLTVRAREPVTSGSVNACAARFEFSPDWEGMERVAVFRAGAESRSVLLDSANACGVPWEVLVRPNVLLQAGVYGTREGAVVLPTVWADLGVILPGASPGEEAGPPAPDLWRQELARKGDALDYDGLSLTLKSGGRALSAVRLAGGGAAYTFGHGLRQEGLNVSVDAVSDFSGDNTLPMTAAGVQASVGNIEALLGTI